MDGSKGSFSRVFASILILMTIIWISFVIFRNGMLPPAIDLTAAAAIITTGVGLYTANKLATPAIIRAENFEVTAQNK